MFLQKNLMDRKKHRQNTQGKRSKIHHVQNETGWSLLLRHFFWILKQPNHNVNLNYPQPDQHQPTTIHDINQGINIDLNLNYPQPQLNINPNASTTMNINHQPSTWNSTLSKAAFDEEENEIRGTLVFKPPVEILPKTRRTEEMQRRKLAAWVLFFLRMGMGFFFLRRFILNLGRDGIYKSK